MDLGKCIKSCTFCRNPDKEQFHQSKKLPHGAPSSSIITLHSHSLATTELFCVPTVLAFLYQHILGSFVVCDRSSYFTVSIPFYLKPLFSKVFMVWLSLTSLPTSLSVSTLHLLASS